MSIIVTLPSAGLAVAQPLHWCFVAVGRRRRMQVGSRHMVEVAGVVEQRTVAVQHTVCTVEVLVDSRAAVDRPFRLLKE